jgi:hypothetical protein
MDADALRRNLLNSAEYSIEGAIDRFLSYTVVRSSKSGGYRELGGR